ncbi:MAG: NADPH:quinone reductase-like Zn-dependent oxidoreductase [Cryomorphaceae bacterium]|jgi:NADPH:quinone reductase-like Zn-dependent oxidoreductase
MHTTSFESNSPSDMLSHKPTSGAITARQKNMRAIVHRSYGTAEVLQRETVDVPSIGEKEVLIEVHCAALDRGTWHLMTGTPYLIRMLGFGFMKPKQPIPGLDVAGRVVKVGSGVTRFAAGDEVFGVANGSFAEYTVANEEKLVIKPNNISFEAAAAATVSGITALEALTDVGKLQAKQKVLVVGASGGVGTYAVQLAKALGAQVTGVASASKADLVYSLGADHVIDYETNYLANSDCRYDLIIDIGGCNKVSSLRSVLTPQGTIVFVGGEGGNRFTGGIGRQVGASLLSLVLEHRMKMFVSSEHHSIMQRFSEFIQSGAVTPSIGQRFDLDDIPAAMHQLESGATRGKTVIRVRS